LRSELNESALAFRSDCFGLDARKVPPGQIAQRNTRLGTEKQFDSVNNSNTISATEGGLGHYIPLTATSTFSHTLHAFYACKYSIVGP
jgi:hypothetical protein